jgi:predicted aspartyl protease
MNRRGNDAMGRFAVEMIVANNRDIQMAEGGALPSDKVRQTRIQGTVDSGAHYLVLPAAIVVQLGLPKEGETTVRYADRRTATRTIVDQVRVELLGRHGTFRAIVEPDRTTALIGAIVLEDLDLLVDCTNQLLRPRDPSGIIAEIE